MKSPGSTWNEYITKKVVIKVENTNPLAGRSAVEEIQTLEDKLERIPSGLESQIWDVERAVGMP